MSEEGYEKHLIVLAAAKNEEMALRGILSRHQSIGIHPITATYLRHPESDPGCVRSSHEYLDMYRNTHHYALVVLDRDGAGCNELTRENIEDKIEQLLAGKGWGDRCAAIVIDPELENWVWSDSPEVDNALGWAERRPNLRSQLRQQGLLLPGEQKPGHPKEAVEWALREVRKPRSSSVYRTLAETVSFERCDDAAFEKLRTILRGWFPRV